jgi:hypothetical protein
VTAICAVISLVVSTGLRGKPWAAGMSMALVALAVSLVLGALAFGLLWIFAAALSTLDSRSANSLDPKRQASQHRTNPPEKPPVRTPPA